MVPILSLWLPILLSAVLVFVASALIHMVLGYHAGDFAPLPREEEVMDALRGFQIPPGEYVMPHAATPAAMKDPVYVQKVEKGPVAFLTVFTGSMSMGAQFAQWFAFCVLVGIFAAYLTGRALLPGAEYMEVFRFSGTVAFVAYALALWQSSIWYRRKWSTTLKSTLDGLIYGLLTAGVFGWLWPGT